MATAKKKNTRIKKSTTKTDKHTISSKKRSPKTTTKRDGTNKTKFTWFKWVE